MFDIDSALRTLIERGGSDLHLKVNSPPVVRLQGELAHLEGFSPLTPEETEAALRHIAEARSLSEFEEAGEADFSYSISGLSRFRVNVFKQRGLYSVVMRRVVPAPPVIESLAAETDPHTGLDATGGCKVATVSHGDRRPQNGEPATP